MPILTILGALILLGVFWWAVKRLAAVFEAPPKVVELVTVLATVIVVIWIVALLTGVSAVPHFELR